MNNLEDIKNRLAAATPGPWDTEEVLPGQFAVYSLPLQDNGGHLGVTGYEAYDGDQMAKDDAEFIAHAPEDIARLVKALEAALGHHEPVMEDGEPVGCYNCDWESGGNEAWPCATVRAINDALA